MTTTTRRPGLRARLLERWTPLFDEDVAVAPLTVEEFATACGWEHLVATGAVGASENPLSLAGLQLSTIFPRHLLRRRDDGRLVPVALEEAVGLVRIALAQQGRSPGRAHDEQLDRDDVHATAAETDAAAEHVDADEHAAAAEHAGTADGDSPDGGGRRRFFFRRRPAGH